MIRALVRIATRCPMCGYRLCVVYAARGRRSVTMAEFAMHRGFTETT